MLDDGRGWFELSRLRAIGWSKWDPIGLSQMGDDWKDDGPCADEYDTYLLQAAGQLWHRRSDDKVADYLFRVETEHMGLSAVPGVRLRASEVVRTLREYVESLRT